MFLLNRGALSVFHEFYQLIQHRDVEELVVLTEDVRNEIWAAIHTSVLLWADLEAEFGAEHLMSDASPTGGAVAAPGPSPGSSGRTSPGARAGRGTTRPPRTPRSPLLPHTPAVQPPRFGPPRSRGRGTRAATAPGRTGAAGTRIARRGGATRRSSPRWTPRCGR